MTTRVCPCALHAPIDGHDRNREQWAIVERMIAQYGEIIPVCVGGRWFRVSRYCIALHGVKAQEISRYGFQEIDSLFTGKQ